jgi:hypothetical protein
MTISKKQRSWLLGAALLLTVAATAAVNSKDEEYSGVVHREVTKPKESNTLETSAREPVKEKEHLASTEMTSAILLVDQLKRPAFSDTVKDMFLSKSWYVPPPPPKIIAAPPPVPTAPPFTYQYIGKMLEETNHPAVFLENKSRIFIVRAGDKLDSQYRVDAIDPPVMTLTYLPLDLKQTVQIGEAN